MRVSISWLSCSSWVSGKVAFVENVPDLGFQNESTGLCASDGISTSTTGVLATWDLLKVKFAILFIGIADSLARLVSTFLTVKRSVSSVTSKLIGSLSSFKTFLEPR